MAAYDNINDACISRNLRLLINNVNTITINKNKDIETKKANLKIYKAVIEFYTYLDQDYTIYFVKRHLRVRNTIINSSKKILYDNNSLALLDIPTNYKKYGFKLINKVYQKIKQ
jgi:hypothetical protein